jgi:SLOG cluster2/TIR domain
VAGTADTSRDPDGLAIAKAVKRYLDTLAVDRFFDEVSIQPGDSLSKELEAEIQDAALVCVRTDNYVSSPWCRKELKLAKENRRPMVVFDALTQREPRSSPLLSNLPSIRLAADDLEDEARLESAVNFVALEVVRFLYTNKQLSLLQEAGLVPADAILLTRPPEVRDLRAIIESAGKSLSSRPLLLHPDPTLSAEEADELEALGAEFATPTGLWKKRLDGLRLGLSLSPGDPAERDALGLGLHVEDAMRVIARQALAAGARLYYGGTLAEGSLTQVLFDMIGAYNRDGLKLPSLVNYTPWPWFEEVDKTWLARHLKMLKMEPCQPPDDALKFAAGSGRGHVGRLNATVEGRYALGRSLTAMRQAITANTDARVVLGGKPHAFMGFLPGIVEEVVLALRAGTPVYLLGGFGGAAHLVVEAIEGRRPVELTRDYQGRISPAYEETLKFYDGMRADSPELSLPAIDYAAIVRELEANGVSALAKCNGLDEEENRYLFTTASVDAALYLIMKGLTKLIPEKPPSDH